MSSIQLNISVPSEMKDFLDENSGLSPSKIFQTAVENIQNSIKHNPQMLEANKEISQLRKWGQSIQQDLQKATEFITIKGLWDEYEKNFFNS